MKKILIPTAIAVLFVSCQSNNAGKKDAGDQADFSFKAEAAPEWSDLLKRQHGWFGGDGIFAFTRNGNEKNGAAASGETVIWFSDTMLGDIEKDSLQPGFVMINNSVALLQGGKPDSSAIRFYWDSTAGKANSIFIPKTPATGQKDYYWLGDGFVNQEKNNDMYIFGYRIYNLPEKKVFGFKEAGNTLIVIPEGQQPPFRAQRQLDIPFFLGRDVDSTGSFGAGLMVNTKEAGAPSPDGYLYIYGCRGSNKQVLAARVKPAEIEAFDKWEFWKGDGWSNDVAAIKPVADRASNELSVSPLEDGRYIMVFQRGGLSRKVAIRIGESPVGPFGPPMDIYDVSEDLKGSDQLFPYNAKAHPVLSAPGELLISYNINSFDFDKDIKKLPNLYRPRFIRLKYDISKK